MSSLYARFIAAGILICAATTPSAQPVYKCEVKSKVPYSHEPCLGAKLVDTTPTQGLDKVALQEAGEALKQFVHGWAGPEDRTPH